MQRRAAAMYLVFFLVVGAGAFGLLQTAEEPTITMEGDAHTAGDTVTLNGQEFTVASADSGNGELSWVNESAVITNSIDNGSEVPVTDVRWDDQSARQEQTFEAGSTVAYNGSEYEVSVNESGNAFTLTRADDASINETYAVGDTVNYQGNEATLTSVDSNSATIVWGALRKLGLPGRAVILWNAFPWHPYDPDEGMLSNRTPTDTELEQGFSSLNAFLELFPDREIIAVGRKCEQVLDEFGTDYIPVRHPANGGAPEFRRQMKEIATQKT
jgi:hypothetical protein